MICLSERKLSIHQNKGLIQLPEISKSQELLIEQWGVVIWQIQEINKIIITRERFLLFKIAINQLEDLRKNRQLFHIIEISSTNLKNTLWGYFIRQYQQIQQAKLRYPKQTQSLYQQN
ncbi:unnamed protein product [Paramecium sonneborni]|uniref:Uncharacterized protein n=1 Tax=Paramecium sonneborni TaxID=65129 RepID=A0A8S1MDJ8_9CILI|nr:unnamed protein product [Paramecium sonneborni]